MKSAGNSNINSRTYASLILSHARRKHVNVDYLKSLFTLYFGPTFVNSQCCSNFTMFMFFVFTSCYAISMTKIGLSI